jgi:peptide/nickel transport system substrate-binding protein
VELAASPPLSQTTNSVNILVLVFGAGLIKAIRDGFAEHEGILDALMRRDPDAAEAAMRAGVRRSVVWLHNEADLAERGAARDRLEGGHRSGGTERKIAPPNTPQDRLQLSPPGRSKMSQKGFPRGISRRRFIESGAALATLPPALAGILEVAVSEKSNAAPAKVLVVVQQPGSLRTVDPGRASEVDASAIMRALYDSLLSLKMADPAPAYATKWMVSSDGLTYVFDLRPDWKFSDGSSVTPEDYIFSCYRQRNNKADASWMLGNVASITKTGPTQITIKLKSLDVDFLKLVPNPGLAVTKAATVREHGGTDADDAATKDTATTWLDQHSVGTGPFVIDHWDRGSELVMRANPHYWGPKTFDTVVFRFVADPTTQRDLLLRGDAHIAVNLTPDLAAELEKRGPASKTAIATVPALGIAYLGFNCKASGPIGQPKAWEAIKYAVDYEGLKKIYLGGGQPVGSIVPPQLPNALPIAEGLKQDVEKAKAALTALGMANGFTFKLTYGADQIIQNVPATDVAQKVKADLAAVGITADLVGEPLTQELTDYRGGKPEAVLHLWAVDYPGWTDFLPNYAPGGHVALPRQNWAVDVSPEAKQIADLTARAMAAIDPKEQLEPALQAQRLINQHGPYAWLFETNYQLGYRTDVIKRLDVDLLTFFNIPTSEFV